MQKDRYYDVDKIVWWGFTGAVGCIVLGLFVFTVFSSIAQESYFAIKNIWLKLRNKEQ